MSQRELHGIAYERYLEKQRDLEYVLLASLQGHAAEPVTIDLLSARYRSNSWLISAVLSEARRSKYIAVDQQQTVTITSRGRDRLKRLQRW